MFHLAIFSLVPHLNPRLEPFIAWAPVALIFLLSGGYGQLGVLLFVGLSLILAGIRGASGCEVMTIPGLFSPGLRRIETLQEKRSPIIVLNDLVRDDILFTLRNSTGELAANSRKPEQMINYQRFSGKRVAI